MTGISKARDERHTRRRGIFSSLYDDFINDRFFSSFDGLKMNNRYSIPAVNINEEEKCYVIAMAVPGMEKDDFNLSLEDNVLYVSVDDTKTDQEEDHNYARQEFNYRSFRRFFYLPEDVDKENIDASYKDGILSLKICKVEQPSINNKVKKIEIS